MEVETAARMDAPVVFVIVNNGGIVGRAAQKNTFGPDAPLVTILVHGLLECLQRDGNGLHFRALDQGVLLDLPDDLEPETRALLERLDGLGIEVFTCKPK